MKTYTLLQFLKNKFIGKRIKISGGYRQKPIVGVVKKISWRNNKYDYDIAFTIKNEKNNRLEKVWCYPSTKIEELLY